MEDVHGLSDKSRSVHMRPSLTLTDKRKHIINIFIGILFQSSNTLRTLRLSLESVSFYPALAPRCGFELGIGSVREVLPDHGSQMWDC